MMVIARHLIIKGRVQGVFYRAWTIETARSLGLSGWVRNLRSGEVETVIQGQPEAIDQFITLAWNGSSAARVDSIEKHEEPVSDFSGFEKRATA